MYTLHNTNQSPHMKQDVALWGRLGYQAAGHMHSFTPQEFAQTMWGFAAANVAYKVLVADDALAG